MKLGDVLRKERERKRLAADAVAAELGLPLDVYKETRKRSFTNRNMGHEIGADSYQTVCSYIASHK